MCFVVVIAFLQDEEEVCEDRDSPIVTTPPPVISPNILFAAEMTERYSPQSCPAMTTNTNLHEVDVSVSNNTTERGISAPPHIDCSITQQPTSILEATQQEDQQANEEEDAQQDEKQQLPDQFQEGSRSANTTPISEAVSGIEILACTDGLRGGSCPVQQNVHADSIEKAVRGTSAPANTTNTINDVVKKESGEEREIRGGSCPVDKSSKIEQEIRGHSAPSKLVITNHPSSSCNIPNEGTPNEVLTNKESLTTQTESTFVSNDIDRSQSVPVHTNNVNTDTEVRGVSCPNTTTSALLENNAQDKITTTNDTIFVNNDIDRSQSVPLSSQPANNIEVRGQSCLLLEHDVQGQAEPEPHIDDDDKKQLGIRAEIECVPTRECTTQDQLVDQECVSPQISSTEQEIQKREQGNFFIYFNKIKKCIANMKINIYITFSFFANCHKTFQNCIFTFSKYFVLIVFTFLIVVLIVFTLLVFYKFLCKIC